MGYTYAASYARTSIIVEAGSGLFNRDETQQTEEYKSERVIYGKHFPAEEKSTAVRVPFYS